MKPRAVTLVCDHVRWYKPPLPNVDEKVWCPACQDYRDVGPAEARFAEVHHAEGWASKPGKKSGYDGRCEWEKDCNFTFHDSNFYRVRDKMLSHQIRDHTKSRFSPQFEYTTIPLPKNSPPPF